ncbi:hypothetical protein L2U69_18575 [Zavarzinia compransoris]|uniref:hypothetical protein n=1 Tax=Zavarzinia marina TaxID=2911065 RepID=UPI001F2E6671|nr:hypothetical protein [Zavarzinia marina]MCF4167657.1 hypothetical protein [Zavarzinia marina]
MRDDMFKVIVERPRMGSRYAKAPKLKPGRDDGLKHIGHLRHVSIAARDQKYLNENLAPLVRFLRSRRGRRWDDVFSEICAVLDTRSAVKIHVRLHLDDFVVSRISVGRHGEWMTDGRIIEASNPWHRGRSFFVDPRDGILKDYGDLLEILPAANRRRKGGAR